MKTLLGLAIASCLIVPTAQVFGKEKPKKRAPASSGKTIECYPGGGLPPSETGFSVKADFTQSANGAREVAIAKEEQEFFGINLNASCPAGIAVGNIASPTIPQCLINLTLSKKNKSGAFAQFASFTAQGKQLSVNTYKSSDQPLEQFLNITCLISEK